jgi:hypothetical protein
MSEEIMADEVKELSFRYEQDSRRFHRYKLIDPEGYITGSIYFAKDMKELPKRLMLERIEKE